MRVQDVSWLNFSSVNIVSSRVYKLVVVGYFVRVVVSNYPMASTKLNFVHVRKVPFRFLFFKEHAQNCETRLLASWQSPSEVKGNTALRILSVKVTCDS